MSEKRAADASIRKDEERGGREQSRQANSTEATTEADTSAAPFSPGPLWGAGYNECLAREVAPLRVELSREKELREKAEAALREEWNAPHVLHLGPNGWTLQHPLRCRKDLTACKWNTWNNENAGDAVQEVGQGYFDLIDHGDGNVELRRRSGPYDSPLYALASASLEGEQK